LLSDAGSGSTVGGTNGKGQLPVALRDLFSVCDAPPDLLKMDIEGGEFAILEDARFAALHPRVVVVEWHKTPAISDPEAWCVERFRALGYECLPISRLGSTGVMWAFEASSRDSNHRRASI
jgi:hypothetical protein